MSIVNRGIISIFKDAYILVDVGVFNSTTVVLILCEIELRRSDTNLYHLDTNWIQVVARKKEKMSFPKVL